MSDPIQHPSLNVEYVTTRDEHIDNPETGGWSTRPMRPLGEGWVIADASSDKHTVWRRVRLVDLATVTFTGQGGQPS